MDKLIQRFDVMVDRDLLLCPGRGVAYQRDMTIRVPYHEAYFNKCLSYEDQPIAKAINDGRVALVDKHAGASTKVLDIGVGSGEFIKNRPLTWGYDINPTAMAWLKEANRWSEEFGSFTAFSMWDVIEHVEEPARYLVHIPYGGYLFVSIPVFARLKDIRQSKHYRPGEHLYYWTEQGFVDWLALYRFKLLEVQDYEIKAGREAILSFAFQRTLPSYHDFVEQHRQRYRGLGIHQRWQSLVEDIVTVQKPDSILDFGCGISDLVAHFWFNTRIARYDPAIPAYEVMPTGHFDLVLCCDVLPHVPMADIDKILREIRTASAKALFIIPLRPGERRLPNGTSSYITMLSDKEWLRWIKLVFGVANVMTNSQEDVLVIRTF